MSPNQKTSKIKQVASPVSLVEEFWMTPPAPTVASQLPLQSEEDWFTYFRMLEAGQLDAYMGRFVAIVNGQVIASGADREELRKAASSLANILANRLLSPTSMAMTCPFADAFLH